MRKVFSLLFTLILLLLVFSFPLKTSVYASDLHCNQYTLPVTLSPTDQTVYHIAAFLCSQGGLEGKTVQVTIHGSTYDHNYWDFPFQQPLYSYVQAATNNGYAVLNIDRIGDGQSDHPNDTLVTVPSNAFVIHEVVQDLRDGTVANTHFSKIILVAHSLGSVVSLFEASTYTDVDGIILSGLLHSPNPAAIPIVEADFYPASLDSKFANSGFSIGYETTRPGTRAQLFYNTQAADSSVIALDETLKQTQTAEENATETLGLPPTVSQAIHVPVLLAMGQNDVLFCGVGSSCQNSSDILSREQSDYSPQACLEAFVLPNSGHDLNLHLNSQTWYAAANDWANRRIGNSVNNPPTQPCQ